jgi:AcrR family transcriptional regulator
MPKILTDADIEAFRERLCDVAEELFATHGPDGVTLRQLADPLGVSSMTPYRYFKDKDAILAAVRTRAFNRFAQAMETAFEAMKTSKKIPGGQPGGVYIDFALKNPAAYRMMFDTNQPTCEDYPDLVSAMDRAKQTMTVGWKHLKAKGMLKGDVHLIGHLHWSAMHGAIMLELAGLLRKPMDARMIAGKAIEALAKQFEILPLAKDC